MTTGDGKNGDPYGILQPGDRVRHPKFGEGQIIQRVGAGLKTKLLVAFPEEGEKRLMARYAKLKKVQPMETEQPSAPDAAGGAATTEKE